MWDIGIARVNRKWRDVAAIPSLVRERDKSLKSHTRTMYVKFPMAGASGEGHRETGWEQMTREISKLGAPFSLFYKRERI